MELSFVRFGCSARLLVRKRSLSRSTVGSCFRRGFGNSYLLTINSRSLVGVRFRAGRP